MSLKKIIDRGLAIAALVPLPLAVAAQSPGVYDGGSTFTRGFARIVKGDKHFYIDTAGQYVFDDIAEDENSGYNSFFSKDSEPVATEQDALPTEFVRVRKNNRTGVISSYGKWLLEPVYDDIDTRWSFAWKVTKDGKRSFYAATGWLLPFRFDSIGYLDGNHFDVEENGKWGIYSSREDKMVIPFEYEEFDYCGGCESKGDYVFAKREGKWGILNFRNEVLLPFKYDHEHINMRSDEWVESLYLDGNRLVINLETGFVDTTGYYDPDFPPELSTGNVSPPYVGVYQNEKFGVTDSSGKVIIPARYSGSIQLGYGKRLFSTSENDTTILFDLSGKRVLKADFMDLEEIGIGGFSGDPNTIYLAKFKKKGLYGFYNPYSGKMIAPRYTKLEGNYNNHYLEVTLGDKTGVIDTSGRVVVPLVYDALRLVFLPGMVTVHRQDRMGVFDIRKNAEIIPAIYDDITQMSELPLISLMKAGLYGYADMEGRIICPVQFNDAERVHNRWLLLKKGSEDTAASYSVFDIQTLKITGLPYKSAHPVYEGSLLVVDNGKGQCLYDLATGRELHGEYTQDGRPVFIGMFEKGLATVVKDSGCGYMNLSGEMIVPAVYQIAAPISENGLGLLAKKDSTGKVLYGFVDTTGRIIVPLEYDYPENSYARDYFEDGLLRLYRQVGDGTEYLVGCATMQGILIAPPIYQGIKRIDDRGFLVRKDGKFGFIAPDGKIIMEAVYEDMALDRDFLSGYNEAMFRFPLLCKENGIWQYIGSDGKPLAPKMKEVVDFNIEEIDAAATPTPPPVNEVP